MNAKSITTSFIAVLVLAVVPASANAATCANPSINVTTEQSIVEVGQQVNYSYSFCYQSQSDHYTSQVIQVQNAEGAPMNTAVSPAQVVAMDGQAGSVTNGGDFVPASAGRYKVVVAYYEKGQSAWESQGEALIIARPAAVVTPPPVITPPPVVTPPATEKTVEKTVPPAAVPATPAPVVVTPPVVTPNPPAVPIGTATEAKISLVKHALHPVVAVGHVASFSMTVKNVSKVLATQVVVCDALPSQTQYVGASKPANFHGASACFTVGNMRPGQSDSIVIRLSINNGTHGTVLNHAIATSTDAKTVHTHASVTVPSAPVQKVIAPVTG
jgi:uncharacterized repeat protein (TIGR01451 family)